MKDPLIFDTTIWIDFLNDQLTDCVLLLREYITFNRIVFFTPVILQEVLQGIKEDKLFKKVHDRFSWFPLLDINVRDAAIGAAVLYRKLKKKGITIRKSNDCLIAFYAIHFDVPIVHNDRDFTLIAQYTPLKIFP